MTKKAACNNMNFPDSCITFMLLKGQQTGSVDFTLLEWTWNKEKIMANEKVNVNVNRHREVDFDTCNNGANKRKNEIKWKSNFGRLITIISYNIFHSYHFQTIFLIFKTLLQNQKRTKDKICSFTLHP